MKNLLLALLFLSCMFSKNTFAQDTLIFKSGLRIIAKVIEIEPYQIHYKRFDNLSGPDYVEKKSLLAEIKFKNGLREEYLTPNPVKKSLQASTWSDFIKLNLRIGAVVNDSYCNVPRPKDNQSQTGPKSEYKELSGRNYTNAFLGLDAQFGASPFFKHLIEVNYLQSEGDFKYKSTSFIYDYASHQGTSTTDFYECHSRVHYLNISSGFRFILFKKFSIDNSLCIINPVLSTNTKSGYQAVNNQYSNYTDKKSREKLIQPSFSYCPKMQFDFSWKKQGLGISVARNFSFQNYQEWWVLGLLYYPFKKLR